jgi:hypothetical protein
MTGGCCWAYTGVHSIKINPTSNARMISSVKLQLSISLASTFNVTTYSTEFSAARAVPRMAPNLVARACRADGRKVGRRSFDAHVKPGTLTVGSRFHR